jgi:hypothetical protein
MFSLFNLSDIKYEKNNPYILIIGSIGFDKSIVIKNIMDKINAPAKVVVHKVNNNNNYYNNINYIYNNYYSQLLNTLFERQELLIKDNLDNRTILTLDACLSSRCDWINNDDIKELFNNKDKHKIMLILSMTFPLGIPLNYRETFDYVFLASEDFTNNKKRLYEHYGNYIFNTFEEFNKIFSIITGNYNNYMVLNMKDKKYFIYNTIYC